MSKNPVVHFEMPAKDKKRAAKFYTNAFDWNMVDTGPNMGNYLVAQTAETDANNMVQTPGAINGGFFDYQDKKGYNMPHLVISVLNLEEAMEKIKAEGGKIEGEPIDIEGIGRYVSFIDPEDNLVGILEPKRK